MRIEIEVHEAEADGGQRVRVRLIREVRDFVAGDVRSVELVRDHDSGEELLATAEPDVYEGTDKRRYRIVRRIA